MIQRFPRAMLVCDASASGVFGPADPKNTRSPAWAFFHGTFTPRLPTFIV